MDKLTQFLRTFLTHLAILVVLTLSLPGCNVIQVKVSYTPDGQLLLEGEKEFELGNFEEAERIFEEIYQSTPSLQTKNTALYNLVATKIINGTSTEDFMSAVTMLKDWKKGYPEGIYLENPYLMVTALQYKMIVFEDERKQLMSTSKQRQEIISNQKKKIIELNNLVDTLRHQITELEAIDQQLQEKKKPL